MLKPVLVHSCIHADMDAGLDLSCSCAKHYTLKDAKEEVASGEAVFKLALLGAVDYRQIIKTGKMTRAPRATTIQASKWWESLGREDATDFVLRGNIERANICGKPPERWAVVERERIEFYGRLTQIVWVNLGAVFTLIDLNIYATGNLRRERISLGLLDGRKYSSFDATGNWRRYRPSQS